MSMKPAVPSPDAVTADLLRRVQILEALYPQGTINEIDSTNGEIVVSNPNGPIVYLTGFKPLMELATGSASFAGTGGGSAQFAHGTGSSLLDYTIPDQPHPLSDGWYQAMVTMQVDGLADGDVIGLDLLPSGVIAAPVALAVSSIGLGQDTPPLSGALNVSFPPVPMTTSDFFLATYGVSTTNVSTIDLAFKLVVTLVSPGVP